MSMGVRLYMYICVCVKEHVGVPVGLCVHGWEGFYG